MKITVKMVGEWLSEMEKFPGPIQKKKYLAACVGEFLREAAAQPERTPLPTVDRKKEMCGNCLYWASSIELCRRYPKTEERIYLSWCGEWKACGKDGA